MLNCFNMNYRYYIKRLLWDLLINKCVEYCFYYVVSFVIIIVGF